MNRTLKMHDLAFFPLLQVKKIFSWNHQVCNSSYLLNGYRIFYVDEIHVNIIIIIKKYYSLFQIAHFSMLHHRNCCQHHTLCSTNYLLRKFPLFCLIFIIIRKLIPTIYLFYTAAVCNQIYSESFLWIKNECKRWTLVSFLFEVVDLLGKSTASLF